jgi:hypothetical protein
MEKRGHKIRDGGAENTGVKGNVPTGFQPIILHQPFFAKACRQIVAGTTLLFRYMQIEML